MSFEDLLTHRVNTSIEHLRLQVKSMRIKSLWCRVFGHKWEEKTYDYGKISFDIYLDGNGLPCSPDSLECEKRYVSNDQTRLVQKMKRCVRCDKVSGRWIHYILASLLISISSYAEGPVSIYSTDSYAFFGTLGNASTFISANGHDLKLTNTGKVELEGDNTTLPTADISTDSDAKRIKIGGGADTNTAHGGRAMFMGNAFPVSPGAVVIQAGDTNNIGQDGKGAFAAIYTTQAQPVIIGVNDAEFVRYEPDRKINILQPVVRLPKGRNATVSLEIRVNGESYLLPLIKK